MGEAALQIMVQSYLLVFVLFGGPGSYVTNVLVGRWDPYIVTGGGWLQHLGMSMAGSGTKGAQMNSRHFTVH